MKDSLLLFDDNERLKRIINSYEFFKDEYKVTTNGEVSLEFRIKDNITDINKGDKIGVFKDDETMDLLIVEQVESETSYSTEYKVTCLHDFYSLQEQKAITQYENKSVSLRDALTTMLDGTTYELGECPERALKAIGPYLFKNVLWCIQDILQLFEVEVYYSIELDSTRTNIVKKKLNVVNALGSDTGIRCSTDLNVSKIKRIEKNKFYTVMYGCGATYQKDNIEYKYSFKDISWSTPNNPADKPLGLEYVEDKEAIAKYGRKIGIYEDGRIKDPNLLLKYTWEALRRNNKPFASYELELEELKNEDGYEHLDFKLGDLIILHNTIDDSRAKFRIVEDIRSISDRQKRKVVIGEQIRGLVSSGSNSNNGTLGPGGSVIPPSAEGDIKPPSIEEIIPDELPAVPVAIAQGLWGQVMLSWIYENKMYYDYEVYASKIRDFEPTVFNKIYSGKASSFLHEVGTKETWYYRVRAVNIFGSSTNFSEQVEATTTKVADGTEFFESAAIKDALIEELRLDRGWIGTLRGHYIDARELTVTDGNGKRTLDIDSFGNVNIAATNISMIVNGESQGVATQSQVQQASDRVQLRFEEAGGYNRLRNSAFKDGTNHWFPLSWNSVGWNPNAYSGLEVRQIGDEWAILNRNTLSAYAANLSTNTWETLGVGFDSEPLWGGRDWTFSCLLASHRTRNIIIEVIEHDSSGNRLPEYNTWVIEGNKSGGQFRDNWHKFNMTFSLKNEGCANFVIRIFMGSWNGEMNSAYLFMAEPMLTLGHKGILPYTPNADELYSGITTIDKDGVTVKQSNINGYTQMSTDKFLLNKDGKDLFKVDHEGLYLEGRVKITSGLDGTSTTGEGGRKVTIDKANYTISENNQERAFLGFKNMGNSYDKYVVPKLALGAYGYNLNHNYFTVIPYRGNDNPQNSSKAYVDIAYHMISHDDYSNIKMYDGGDIRLAPVKDLEITTNCENAEYKGIEERRLALFSTSGSTFYNGHLQIGAIVNATNGKGLVLEDSRNGNWCSVQVNVDSSGAKFFRPLENGNTELGSLNYRWKNIFATSTYSTQGIVLSSIENPIASQRNMDDGHIIENINFIEPLSKSDNESLVMDVTNIVGTSYIEVSEDGQPYMNDTEMIKLLLKEVKQLKEEIKALKGGA